MQATESPRAEGIRRLYELMLRVNSSTDLSEVLDEIARGVVEVLGYGIAAIARLEGETFVMTTVAGPEEVREQIIGRRTPVASIFNEFAAADEWGVLRFVPHGRMPDELEAAAWVPDFEPEVTNDAWHPLDALYAPLYSATGQLLGNMSVDLPPGNRIPNKEERELLEMFVVQAGLAMYNAQQRERLGDQVRMGEMLRAVSSAGQLAELDQSLYEAAQAVAKGLEAERLWIRCFTSGDLGQVTQSAAYPPEDPEAGLEMIELKGQLARQAWEFNRPVMISQDNLSDPFGRFSETERELVNELLRGRPEYGLMAVPVAVGRELLGYVLLLRDVLASPWTQEEQQGVMEVGRTLGRVVLNARLYERERHLVGELQELDRYKGELIATISHELKTPLTSIIGHVELLEDMDTGIGSVEAISRNAERLNRLVQNLLAYSQVQDKRETVRMPVDLRKLAEGTVELLAMHVEPGLGGDDAEHPRRAGDGHRRPRRARQGDRQPGQQRRQVHAARWLGAPGGAHRRRPRDRAVRRHRPGDLRRRPGAPVLGVPPLQQPRGALHPRHRPGPGDLPPDRPDARRRDPGRLRARQGQHLPPPAAAARRGAGCLSAEGSRVNAGFHDSTRTKFDPTSHGLPR